MGVKGEERGNVGLRQRVVLELLVVLVLLLLLFVLLAVGARGSLRARVVLPVLELVVVLRVMLVVAAVVVVVGEVHAPLPHGGDVPSPQPRREGRAPPPQTPLPPQAVRLVAGEAHLAGGGRLFSGGALPLPSQEAQGLGFRI